MQLIIVGAGKKLHGPAVDYMLLFFYNKIIMFHKLMSTCTYLLLASTNAYYTQEV